MTATAGKNPVTRLDITFHIKLTLEAPILTRATEASPGFSETAARDHLGRLYLPNSLIKGNLKQYCLDYNWLTEDEMQKLFGFKPETSTNNQPGRGLLHFSDFTCENPPDHGISTRIEIDSDRGAVSSGQLVFMELPFAPGREVVFTGIIRAAAENDEELKKLFHTINTVFRLVPAFGGQQGIGYGRLKKVTIDHKSKEFPQPPPLEKIQTCDGLFNLSLTPLAPFCLAGHLPLKNRFEGEEIISGGAIKGIMAHTLNRITGRDINSPIDGSLPLPWTELGKHFSRIKINHAFPIESTSESGPTDYSFRPKQPPLTTVRAADNTYDIALKSGPGLIAGKAPSFAADWKGRDWRAVKRHFGWPENLRRILRVRTAIDSKRRRAMESELFAMECIVPDNHEWLCQIDLCYNENPVIADPETRKRISSQLCTLFEYGLFGLGKTKVELKTQLTAAKPHPLECKPLYRTDSPDNPLWIITLQTNAMIVHPKVLAGPDNCTSDKLTREYQQYWHEIDKDLQLDRHFSCQVLYGRYLSRRFQKGKPYNPYLLVKAGSVFILSSQGNKRATKRIGETLAKLQKNNLPLPGWAGDIYGEPIDWQNCPWLAKHGFGEICVNLPFHGISCPEWEDI
ncbi:hypothetical protein DGMP_11740 [Desulfomarina profundi]|uniref:CRISPR type III-associated protein domain-containing protein n=1 Tax=Desulfomarina profundi TaxID=2772557 RepID=A0A8D5FH15_9BACT|nr:RAMP superfamily CRISPR-associated protein [Desulfomarina profundi]BCL60481.1 hypothetical protein DGMP_11740 [Desulfomarina profundi]